MVVYLKHAADAADNDKCSATETAKVANGVKTTCYFKLDGDGNEAKIIVEKVVEPGATPPTECQTTSTLTTATKNADGVGESCCAPAATTTFPLASETTFDPAVKSGNAECAALEAKVAKEREGSGTEKPKTKCTAEDTAKSDEQTACYFQLDGTKIKFVKRIAPGQGVCKKDNELNNKKKTECCAAAAAIPPLKNATHFTDEAAPAGSGCADLQKTVKEAIDGNGNGNGIEQPNPTSPKDDKKEQKTGESSINKSSPCVIFMIGMISFLF